MVGADSRGRAVVAGSNGSNDEMDVVRLNAAGTAIDYTVQVPGQPTVIRVDNSGAAFVAG